MAKNNLKEELDRFKTLLGYDPSLGNITESKRREAPGYRDYMGGDTLNEAEPEEETTEEEPSEDEDTTGGDFDFGDAGSPEGEETTEEPATEEMPDAEEEPQEDEFGTADEFSASDELGDDEVEEIDVTAIVDKSEEAKNLAQKAVTVGEKNTEFLQTLTDKLSNLEASLSKMDTIASKLSKLEQDIKTPEEKLELRSLDSYPFNMKLTDYWEEKAAKDKNYRISTGKEYENGKEKEYVINPEDIDDYNESDIQSSFMS